MAMSMLGRALAIAGAVAGLLAIGLPLAFDARYLDDGTVTAFLLVLLCLSTWLPADIGRDLMGATAGAAAFGFLLFVPSTLAFDNLGRLDAGGWLGICTVLIPIGGLVMQAAQAEPGGSKTTLRVLVTERLGFQVAAIGLVLVVAGIWLDTSSNGPSYWNAASSGHAVGLAMLVLTVATVLALCAPAIASGSLARDVGVLVAAVTFGYVEAGLVSTAFENFGSLGAGAWLEACAGVLLLLGTLRLRADTVASAGSAAGAAPAPAG